MPEELKPCPFCGGEGSLEQLCIQGVNFFWIECLGCGIRTEALDVLDWTTAPSQVWNKREVEG